MRRHEIITRLYPAAPIALVANTAFRALADEVNFTIPLPIARTERATNIKITVARLARNTIKGMGIMRGRTSDDALFM